MREVYQLQAEGYNFFGEWKTLFDEVVYTKQDVAYKALEAFRLKASRHIKTPDVFLAPLQVGPK